MSELYRRWSGLGFWVMGWFLWAWVLREIQKKIEDKKRWAGPHGSIKRK